MCIRDSAAAITASWNTWPFCTGAECEASTAWSYYVPLQDDNTVFSTHRAANKSKFVDAVNHNLSSSYAQFNDSINGFCNQSTAIVMQHIVRKWDNVSYNGMHIQQQSPAYFANFRITSWMPPGYYPWLMLLFIFLVSVGFQGFRYTKNNVYGAVSEFSFPSVLVKYVFFQGTTCVYLSLIHI